MQRKANQAGTLGAQSQGQKVDEAAVRDACQMQMNSINRESWKADDRAAILNCFTLDQMNQLLGKPVQLSDHKPTKREESMIRTEFSQKIPHGPWLETARRASASGEYFMSKEQCLQTWNGRKHIIKQLPLKKILYILGESHMLRLYRGSDAALRRSGLEERFFCRVPFSEDILTNWNDYSDSEDEDDQSESPNNVFRDPVQNDVPNLNGVFRMNADIRRPQYEFGPSIVPSAAEAIPKKRPIEGMQIEFPNAKCPRNDNNGDHFDGEASIVPLQDHQRRKSPMQESMEMMQRDTEQLQDVAAQQSKDLKKATAKIKSLKQMVKSLKKENDKLKSDSSRTHDQHHKEMARHQQSRPGKDGSNVVQENSTEEKLRRKIEFLEMSLQNRDDEICKLKELVNDLLPSSSSSSD